MSEHVYLVYLASSAIEAYHWVEHRRKRVEEVDEIRDRSSVGAVAVR